MRRFAHEPLELDTFEPAQGHLAHRFDIVKRLRPSRPSDEIGRQQQPHRLPAPVFQRAGHGGTTCHQR